MLYYLKNNILVAVAERRSERIGRVRAARPVQDDWSLGRRQSSVDLVPFGVRRNHHRCVLRLISGVPVFVPITINKLSI